MNTSATRLDRRLVLQAAGGGILLSAGAPRLGQASEKHAAATEVSATEDMMREHGVLRRALLIYAETVPRWRADASAIEAKALNDTAKLFRAFREDYHERKLEEPYVFPAVRRAGGRRAPRCIDCPTQPGPRDHRLCSGRYRQGRYQDGRR
jgi:hypothetical protein